MKKIIRCTKCKKKYNRCECLKYQRPLIGLISAFVPELSTLQDMFSIQFPSIEKGGRLFFRAILDNIYIVVVVCGVGMTNAAMTTQLLIDLFCPKNLIFSGIAGAINTDHPIGTIIFAKRFGQYKHQKAIQTNSNNSGVLLNTFIDDSIDLPNKFFRYNRNKVLSFDRPNCDNCDNIDPVPATSKIINNSIKTPHMNIPMEIETLVKGNDAFADNVPSQFFFNVDRHLLKQVEIMITKGIRLPKRIHLSGVHYTPKVVIGDFGGSASTFLNNIEYRDILFNEFSKADVIFEFIDMESAAFAHVAVSNKVPFLVLRSLSDLNNISQEMTFLQTVVENNIYVLRKLFRRISNFNNKNDSKI